MSGSVEQLEGGEAVYQPYSADVVVMGEHFEELLGEHAFGDDLYGVYYALRNPGRHESVNHYLFTQEVTHIQEGVRLRQCDSTAFTFTGERTISSDGKPMTQVAKDGLKAQELAFGRGEGFEFMIVRNQHDVSISEDNDRRMKESPVGSSWMRITPFEEEVSVQEARSAGFYTETKRAFMWLYRKKDEGTLEVTVISVDQSDVTAFAGLMKDHGIELPVDVKSHDIPAFAIEFDGLVLCEEDRDALIGQQISRYKKYAEFVDASGLDMTSREFIDKFCQTEIMSVVRLQEEIRHSLEAGSLTEFTQESIKAVLGQDYLDDLERRLLARLLNKSNILVDDDKEVAREVKALRLLVKAHRVGVWKGINEKIKQFESTGLQGSETGAFTASQSYIVGGGLSIQEIAQLQENSANTQRAAEAMEIQPGCPGGAGFLSQNTQDQLKESTFKDSKNETYKFDNFMNCVVCDPGRKKPKTYCGPCGICRPCDKKMQRSNR